MWRNNEEINPNIGCGDLSMFVFCCGLYKSENYFKVTSLDQWLSFMWEIQAKERSNMVPFDKVKVFVEWWEMLWWKILIFNEIRYHCIIYTNTKFHALHLTWSVSKVLLDKWHVHILEVGVSLNSWVMSDKITKCPPLTSESQGKPKNCVYLTTYPKTTHKLCLFIILKCARQYPWYFENKSTCWR